MKKLIVGAVVALLGCQAYGVTVSQGLYEMQLGAAWDILYDGHDRTVPVQAGLSYYVSDDTQIGAFLTFAKKNNDSFWGVDDTWGLGAFFEYNYLTDGILLPYSGASIGIVDGNAAGGDSVVIVSAFGGAKFFVTQVVALTAQLNLNWCNEDIYDFDRNFAYPNKVKGEGEQFDISGSLGLRIVLW
jgi:hypothetical protein